MNISIKTRTTFVFITIFFMLVGCGSIPKLQRIKPIEEEKNELIDAKNIEVISILSDTYDSVYLGASRLTNKQYESDTESWAINDFLTGLTIEAIQQDKRFNYIDSKINRNEFNSIYTNRKLSTDNFDIKYIQQQLDILNRVHNVDTLILIIENKIEDPIKDTTHAFSGYGAYQNALSFKSIYLYSYLRVLVIDTRTKSIKKEKILTDYIKLSKEYWAEQLDELPSKEGRYIRNESLRMAGNNVLGALVKFNLINEEVAYTTVSGTKFVTNRLQEADNYGELYEDAVDRVYKALHMEKHFERYALLMKTRHEDVIDNFNPYKEIYLRWMRDHVSWELLKPRIIEEYRKEFTADELNDIADFAETEAGAKMLAKIPTVLHEQESIWLEEAKKKVDILDKEVIDFSQKIVH